MPRFTIYQQQPPTVTGERVHPHIIRGAEFRANLVKVGTVHVTNAAAAVDEARKWREFAEGIGLAHFPIAEEE